MSETGKINFGALLREARDEMTSLKEFYSVLVGKINNDTDLPELKEWLTDVFADKVYASYSKILKILKKLNVIPPYELEYNADTLTDLLTNLAFSNFNRRNVELNYLPKIKSTIDNFNIQVEHSFVKARKDFHQSGWSGLTNVEPVGEIDTQRKKYVGARESLAKARKCLDDAVEDVPIHLRSAIDLSIKERFDFKKIQPMMGFIKDADKFDFPLPSYELIYDLFDEGSSRIHSGKGNTVFEAKQMIRMVSDFIDSLEMTTVSQEQIQEFVRNSNSVESNI